MASSPSGSVISTGSTSSSFPVIQPQSQIISSKLTENNFLIWRQQVLAAVRGYGLEGYLSGETSAPSKFTKDAETHLLSINPEYMAFQRQDQLLASWLLSSLSDSILALMVGLDSVAEMWQTLETNFSSHSQARQMQYKLQLSTMKKGNQSMREFISKVKLCCDALAAAGHKVKDCDQLMHICAGLGSEYDPIVCAITSKHEPYNLSDASALLLSFEARLEATNTVTTDENHNIVAINLAVQGNKKEGNHSSTQNYRGRGFQQRGGCSGRYRGRGGRMLHCVPACQGRNQDLVVRGANNAS
ncbi:hypothetical protein DH2020_028139 [Rehmannia glutinosa]|uniref:Retrotransposon Copia-like N-terminal domain-containing protein n=1 Tax=Rehmannia glutinosa TaxID=99300 RepID=A0ABR0VSA5_REHGL